MEVLRINSGLFVPKHRVILCVEYKGASSKRILKQAKAKENYIDASGKKGTKSLILLDNDCVIMTPLLAETIAARMNSVDKDEFADNLKKEV